MYAKINLCFSVCPFYGGCPLLGVSINRGFTVVVFYMAFFLDHQTANL